MDSEDTTRTGVSETAEVQQKSSREEMMERISSQVDEERVGQEVTAEVQPAEETPAGGQPAAEKVATDEKELVVVDDPQRFKVRVSIGGQEQERTVGEVLAELSTTRGRLHKQSQQARDLEAREREIGERERQLALQQSASSADTDTDDGLEDALAALVDGDTGKAAAMLREVIGKGRQSATPQIDEAKLVEKVAGQVKDQLESSTVFDDFLRDYPEFQGELNEETGEDTRSPSRKYGDYLWEQKYLPLFISGDRSHQQALRECAEEVRQLIPPPSDTTRKETETAGTRPEKTERERRKERLDDIPVAAGARTAQTAQQTAAEDDSPAATIREMRKARNLPV